MSSCLFSSPETRNSLLSHIISTSELSLESAFVDNTANNNQKMSLKQEVRDWLLKKVFRDKGRPKAKKAVAAGSNPFVWSILVLDSTTLRIVQSCFQGYELGLKEMTCTRVVSLSMGVDPHLNKRRPLGDASQWCHFA